VGDGLVCEVVTGAAQARADDAGGVAGGEAAGLEPLSQRQHVLMAEGVLQLGQRAQRETERVWAAVEVRFDLAAMGIGHCKHSGVGLKGPMITALKRYFARRRLKPVVSALPRRLVRAFGPGEHYTFLQAKRAISDLRLSDSLERYAYAVACRFRELEKGDVALSASEYQRLRAELAELFDLRHANFTIRELLATPYSSDSPGMDSMVGLNVPSNPGSGDAPGMG
jgi:hypothetical protein